MESSESSKTLIFINDLCRKHYIQFGLRTFRGRPELRNSDNIIAKTPQKHGYSLRIQ